MTLQHMVCLINLYANKWLMDQLMSNLKPLCTEQNHFKTKIIAILTAFVDKATKCLATALA